MALNRGYKGGIWPSTVGIREAMLTPCIREAMLTPCIREAVAPHDGREAVALHDGREACAPRWLGRHVHHGG